MESIIHFGKEQVFGNKVTTYTCILVLKKCKNDNFIFEQVLSFLDWELGKRYYKYTRQSNELTENPWMFIYGPLEQTFKKLMEIKTPLTDYANIYVGLQTSNDRIYIIKPKKEKNGLVEFIDWKGQVRFVEKELLKPALYNFSLQPFLIPFANAKMIFPYRVKNRKAELIKPTEMRSKYINAWKYLSSYSKELKKRNLQKGPKSLWYRYGRSQSLTKFDGRPHIVIKVLSLEPTFCVDNKNIVFTGGGNGPYYGVSLKEDNKPKIDILYLQGILNSPLLDLYVHSKSSVFREGYFSYGKQFIENFPLLVIKYNSEKEKKMYNSIVGLSRKLNALVTKKEKCRIPSKVEQIDAHNKVLKQELNELIYEVYGLSIEERKALSAFEA